MAGVFAITPSQEATPQPDKSTLLKKSFHVLRFSVNWMTMMFTSYTETVTDTETAAQTLPTNNHPHKASCPQASVLHTPKTHAETNHQI